MDTELKRIARGLENLSNRVATLNTIKKLIDDKDVAKNVYQFISSKKYLNKLMKKAQKQSGTSCKLVKNTFTGWLKINDEKIEVISVALFESLGYTYVCTGTFAFDYDFKVLEDYEIFLEFETLKRAEQEFAYMRRVYNSRAYMPIKLKG